LKRSMRSRRGWRSRHSLFAFLLPQAQPTGMARVLI
jgi:hypothetical protein